jgi:hypothetical protein
MLFVPSIAEPSLRRQVDRVDVARAVTSGAGAAAASGLAQACRHPPASRAARANSATRLAAAMIGRILVVMVFPPPLC